jgi:hypothetical protein
MNANTKPVLLDPTTDPAADPVVEPAAAAAIASVTAAPDPFDLASLRLNPAFIETAGVKRLITTVPVKKPSPQDFVRVHPASEFRENFAMVDLKDDREEYIVVPALMPDLASESVYKTLFTAVNRQGVVFLWPVRLPAPDDRRCEWHQSAREAAELAMTRWVRMKANRSLGAYEIAIAESVIAEPVWPDVPYGELLHIAFRGRIITTLDHPVIRRLRGLT